jgi:hypothetical protein
MNLDREILKQLTRIADALAPTPILAEADPYHDEGNATNQKPSPALVALKQWEKDTERIASFSEANAFIDGYQAALSNEFAADPYHDEGNATNHRLSQCGPHCKETA